MFTYFALFVGMALIALASTKIEQGQVAKRSIDFGYLRSRHALLLLPLIFGGYYILIQAVGAFTLIISKAVGTDSLVYFALPMSVAATLASFLVGRLADRYSKPTLLYLLCGLGMVSIGFLTLSSNLVMLWIGAMLNGLFFGSVYSVVLALLKERVQQAEFDKAVGAFYVYNTAGMLAGLLVASAVDPRWSYLPGVICLLIAIPALRTFDRENSPK